jgi:hypothetical protein
MFTKLTHNYSIFHHQQIVALSKSAVLQTIELWNNGSRSTSGPIWEAQTQFRAFFLWQFWDFMKPLLCPVHEIVKLILKILFTPWPSCLPQRLRPQMFRDTSIERMSIMCTDEIWTHKCSRMHTEQMSNACYTMKNMRVCMKNAALVNHMGLYEGV